MIISKIWGIVVHMSAIDRTDTLYDLGDYNESGTYDGMMNFLTESLI